MALRHAAETSRAPRASSANRTRVAGLEDQCLTVRPCSRGAAFRSRTGPAPIPTVSTTSVLMRRGGDVGSRTLRACLQGRTASRSTSPWRACKESNLVRRIWNPLRDLRTDPRAPRAGFDPASLARQASRDTSRVTRHSRGFAPLPAQVPPILAPASVGRSHEPGPRFGDYLRGRRSRLESDQHDAV